MQRLRVDLPAPNLAYSREGSAIFDDYVEAVGRAQDYATENRREMMRLIIEAIEIHLPALTVTDEAINCHHNYVVKEHDYGADVRLTRKGAIRTGKDELGIIPGNKGAKSYTVRGSGTAAHRSQAAPCAH